MIIVNGHIKFLSLSGGGIDAQTGYAIAGAESEGAAIPCQYIPKTLNYLSKDNGEPITKSSYEILIEDKYKVQTERLNLYDIEGTKINTFSVVYDTHLQAVRQRKIVV